MALVNEKARILSNECVGPLLYVMVLESPEIAAAVEPGQFVHMLVPGMGEHILRRPFSVYAADAMHGTVDILYQVVGYGSDHMTTLTSDGPFADQVEMIGPVGHGWQAPAGAKRALLVGGGVGAAPLFMLAESLVANGVSLDVVLGAQTEAALTCRNRYEQLLMNAKGDCAEAGPRCATDDGSYGRSGFCTSLVEEALDAAKQTGEPYDYLAVCGPEPLMKIVARMGDEAGVPTEISMEKRMACGIGACLSCVVDTVDGKKRACVDGPVFKSNEVMW